MTTQPDKNTDVRRIELDLPDHGYPIYCGHDWLDHFPDILRRHCPTGRVALISDDNIANLYGSELLDKLAKASIPASLISFPPGESSKYAPTVETIYNQLFDLEFSRSDIIVGFGGGVVGDVAGFVAATFKRGLPFVQLPTSLLAMVDSSVGGKTGINHPRGKNMIGAFYQPAFVFIDARFLSTLPPRERSCGLAETVKHAVIRDETFFQWLEQHQQPILQLDPPSLLDLIENNCRIKAAVVAADERETGYRGLLNLGHTVGHALETVLGPDIVLHGEAVAVGMIAAARLAQQRQLLDAPAVTRLQNLLQSLHLPVSLTQPAPLHDLYHAMQQDKKVRDQRITFILPERIGACVFVNDIAESEIKTILQTLGPS